MGPGSGPLMDLRKLRYFVTVAEELHFGRAADRLFVTQPVLSRQIRQLETELGTSLLHRTSRSVELTPAGEHLLGEARTLLAAADAARRRMSGVAAGEATLRVGFFVGDHFAAAIRAFRQERPDVAVDLHRIYWHDQVDVLHDGRADVAFVHLPIDAEGLELMPVRKEPRIAVLPADHPCAGRESVSIMDLADDPVITQRGAPEAWQAFHDVDPRPDGRHPTRGPSVDNIEEKLERVAAGQGISFLPASAARAVVQEDVVFVGVSDVPPIPVCLAWRAGGRTSLVDAFARAVRLTNEGDRPAAARA